MTEDNDALAAAYAKAKPLMDEIAPIAPGLQAHLAGFAMVVRFSAAKSDRAKVQEVHRSMKRCIAVLSQIAGDYHELVGRLVAETLPAESEEENYEQLE